jgi:hypothetical protein
VTGALKVAEDDRITNEEGHSIGGSFSLHAWCCCSKQRRSHSHTAIFCSLSSSGGVVAVAVAIVLNLILITFANRYDACHLS